MTNPVLPPPLSPPPEALVVDGELAFGSYSAPVPSVNPLDHWSGISRRVHALRLKEWQAFQLTNEEYFVLGAVYDTKSLGILQVVVVEKATGWVRRYERKVPSPALSIAQGLFGTRSRGSWWGLEVVISNDAGGGRIGISAHDAGDADRGPLSLAIDADCSAAAAGHIVICHPFPDGSPLYSDKCAMPASGSLSAGDRTVAFEPADTILILDDHKGHYPWPMAYDWLTGARVLPDGRRAAFNLTDNQVRDPSVFNENVVFLDTTVHRLPAVRFERPGGPRGPWRVRDAEGLVDVTFQPEVSNDQHVGPRRILAEYYGPFGWVSGRLWTPDGEVSLDGFYGMGEQKVIRV